MRKTVTLLDRAERELRMAKYGWENRDGDVLILCNIAFSLQHAIALIIQYQLEQNGIEYSFSMGVEQLIQLAKESENIVLTGYIVDNAEMLSLWETHTRYDLDYYVEEEQLKKALFEASDFLKKVK